MFESLQEKIKQLAFDGIESLCSNVTGVNNVDFRSAKGIANFFNELTKKALGLTDELIVPGLISTRPSTPTPSPCLTLKLVNELIDDLETAKKKFKDISSEHINADHQYETLRNLEPLISLLKTLSGTMKTYKKKCPLRPWEKIPSQATNQIVTALNNLHESCKHVPEYLTSGTKPPNVQTKFYTHYVKEYEQLQQQVRAKSVTDIKDLATKHLLKYHISWGLIKSNSDTFPPNDPPKPLSDATHIYTAIKKLPSNGRVFNSTTEITLDNGKKQKVIYQDNPKNPSELTGEKPLMFDYEGWYNIYINTDDNEIKKIAESKAQELHLKYAENTTQIYDISKQISALVENTTKTLKTNSTYVIPTLYKLLNYIPTNTDNFDTAKLKKQNADLAMKVLKSLKTLQTTKKQIETKFPYLKDKNLPTKSKDINEMQKLLKYSLNFQGSVQNIAAIEIDGKEIYNPTTNEGTINLKENSNKLLKANPKVRTLDPEKHDLVHNLKLMNQNMNTHLSFVNDWARQVNELSGKLDPEKATDLTGATTRAEIKYYLKEQNKTINANPRLKSLKRKIDALMLLPGTDKRLEKYYKELKQCVSLVTNNPAKDTITEISATELKTKKDINDLAKNHDKLDQYNKMCTYYSMKLTDIKKHPKFYANLKNCLSGMPLNDHLWALTNQKKVQAIYQNFKIYQKSLSAHPELYAKTCAGNSKYLTALMKLPLVLNDPKLKSKVKSLLELCNKFAKNPHFDTPETYIDLNNKINHNETCLRTKVNGLIFDEMSKYKENHQPDKCGPNANPKISADEQKLEAMMDQIDKQITANTENLGTYITFLGILNRKSLNSKARAIKTHQEHYSTMCDYYSYNLLLINKHKKFYGNLKKCLSGMPLNDPSWASTHLDKVDKIYKNFTICHQNLRAHLDLYEQTCKKNSAYLTDILKNPSVTNNSKLKRKIISLDEKCKEFEKDPLFDTPEAYIKLNQDIESLKKEVANAKQPAKPKPVADDKGAGNAKPSRLKTLINKLRP